MGLSKANIVNVSKEGEAPIEVSYNPTDYSVSRGANYAEIAVPGSTTPILQFVRGEASTLKMELLIDGTDGRADVHDQLLRLRKLVEIDGDLHTPPVVQFNWGSESFQGVVTQFEEKMSLFDSEGNVLRSRVSLTFKSYKSVPEQVHGTKKASPDRTRVRVLREGETLAHVAFEAYGDPALWRAIAEENRIDRPRFVPAGTVLRVPKV
jgi:hypothetical protein